MNTLLTGIVIAALVNVIGAGETRIESIDVEQVLSNERILLNYIRCIMDEGPCTQAGKDLKKSIPSSLRSGCAECPEKQRAQTQKVMRHIKTKRPNEWNKLIQKFDPDGKYKSKYEDI